MYSYTFTVRIVSTHFFIFFTNRKEVKALSTLKNAIIDLLGWNDKSRRYNQIVKNIFKGKNHV